MFRAIGVLTASAVLSLAVAGSTMASSRTGGSTASACQQNGWTVGQTWNGGTFPSKDACLFYVRLGGTVYKPSFVFSPSSVPTNTDAWMYVTGFHPNSHGTLTETLIGGPNAGTQFSFLGVPTNAQGNMAVISTVFTACDGTVGAAWTFVDDYGVHAAADVYVICRVG